MYETPILDGPAELYETPLLVDVNDSVAGICLTAGSCDEVVQT